MSKEESQKTMLIALAAGSLFDTHLSELRKTMEEAEFNELKKKIGRCMGSMYSELLNPIWESNPDLRPTFVGGNYQVDEKWLSQAKELCQQLHSDI